MTIFGWGVIALVCALSYANAIDAGFVYDDLVNITQRASLRWDEISLSNWIGALVDNPSKRPISLATFGLQYYFGVESARAFHGINIAIHFANGVLVAALARVLLQRAAMVPGQAQRLPNAWLPWLALATALIFIAHPIQTQSVTYVVQRMNSLAAMFHLIALLCFIWGRRSESSGRRASLFALAVVAWALGLGSKETAIVAPVAAWLYELYFERDFDRGFVRQSGAVALFVGIPTVVAAYVMLEMSGYRPFSTYPDKDFNALERLMSQPRILVFYVSQLAWPAPSRLSLLHEFEVSRSLLAPVTTLPAIGLVAIGLAAVVGLAKRHRLLSFALAWFFLHLAVESTVLPLALAMEHRLYLPLFGVALGAVAIAARAFAGRPQIAAAVLTVVIVLFAGTTHSRNAAWLTPETLWRDVLSKYPNSFAAALNLGFDLAGQGRHEEALEYYRHADELIPGDTRVQTNIGAALSALGRYEEAIPQLRGALMIDEENHLALRSLGRALVMVGRVDEGLAALEKLTREDNRAESWVAHGHALLIAGRHGKARRSFARAAQAAPAWAEPQLRLGIVAAHLGAADRAVEHFERAVSLTGAPSGELESHLGLAYLELGNEKRAISHLEKATALNPAWNVGKNNLAWVLATAEDPALRNGERALELARSALQSNTRDGDFLSTMAAALAELGRYDDAVQMTTAALAAARTRSDTKLVTDLQQRAADYAAAAERVAE